MVARIAPSPITTAVASSDAPTHGVDSAFSASFRSNGGSAGFVPQHEVAQIAPPPPLTPPGEAFAAAVIAGQLPPRPVTPDQLRQRLGSAWQPPASPLRLMDRSA